MANGKKKSTNARVLEMLAAGDDVEKIAKALHVSEGAVKTRISRMRKKRGVKIPRLKGNKPEPPDDVLGTAKRVGFEVEAPGA